MAISVKPQKIKNQKAQAQAWWEKVQPNDRYLTTRTYELAKRALDLLVVGMALPLLLPIFLLVALFIKLDSPISPVFQTYECTGKHGRRFYLYKFTTSNKFGVTAIGNVLRMTGLDQLPQLINLLYGEMTLVGPRPITAPVNYYTTRFPDRLEVTPGLTGLWQVAGDNSMSLEETTDLDMAYVKRRGLWFDIVLLAYTVIAVLK